MGLKPWIRSGCRVVHSCKRRVVDRSGLTSPKVKVAIVPVPRGLRSDRDPGRRRDESEPRTTSEGSEAPSPVNSERCESRTLR